LVAAVKPPFEIHRYLVPRAGQEDLDPFSDGASDEGRGDASAVLSEAAAQAGGESDVVAGVAVRAAEVQEVDGAENHSVVAR
jgi:hypothetical protein